MGYAFTTLIKSGGDITDTVDILLLRGFLSPAGHMAWTGIAAAALYAAAATRRRREILQFAARSSSPWSCIPCGTARARDRHRGRRVASPACSRSPPPRARRGSRPAPDQGTGAV